MDHSHTLGNLWEEKWSKMEEDANPIENQVGGLKVNNIKKVFLKVGEYVLKPLQTNNRGLREVAFYAALRRVTLAKYDSLDAMKDTTFETWKSIYMVLHEIQKPDERMLENMMSEIALLQRLAIFTSPYHGTIRRKLSPANHDSKTPHIDYMVLDDATANFSRPCVMDLKMGQKTYEPDAPPKKKENECSKYPMQEIFGFRIVGMTTFSPSHPNSNESGFLKLGKEFGVSRDTEEKVQEGLSLFFNSRINVMNNAVAFLETILNWFEENKSFSFFASSILIVYEGDKKFCGRDSVCVRMIDFAHVRRNNCVDPGYLAGIQNLIRTLNQILRQ